MSDVISNEQVENWLRFDDAYTAVKQSFLDLAHGLATNEPRHRTPTGEGSFNIMWAVSQPLDSIALKAYPVIRADVRQAAAIYITLYSKSTGDLKGTLRGDSLGQRRTGAASVVAAELMGRTEPRVLTVFGTGFQARGQIDAFLHRFGSIQELCVVGRNRDAAARLAEGAAKRFPRLTAEVVEAEEGAARANMLVTATGSPEPVFDGSWLRPGTHISAIGSNHNQSRELDTLTLERCSLVVVDSRATAIKEGGDLLLNGYNPEDAYEVTDIALGHAPLPGTEEITLFDSHGLAVQDLYVAEVVLAAAKAVNVTYPHQPD